MELKQYIAQDLEKCTTTFINVFNAEPWNDEWTVENATRYLMDFTNTPGFFGLLAWEQEEIIGFIFGVRRAWWSGDEFFIHEMCVTPSQQHSGIGTALLNELIQALQPDAIQNITLLTNRGIPAEAFYKKMVLRKLNALCF